MAWNSLSQRLTSLPLLIAGPIVRRVEANSVSVWFVLKENRNVTLSIYEQNTGGSPITSGSRDSGVAIGNHVYVYCVTAIPLFPLSSAKNYFYDIVFGGGESLSGFIAKGLDLTFDGSNRPSFALPPDDLDQVRLVHGSCRKPHGEGYDAMEGVHDMILQATEISPVKAINPIDRPHQLFLTGDQIYADDVADVMLFMIDDAASILFEWDEDYAPFTANELKPGHRNTNDRMRRDVGFTGMLPLKPYYSKSHLLKFREYATMYLFAWSDTLWPNDADLPNYDDIHPGAYKNVREQGEIPIAVPIFTYFHSELNFVRIFKSTISRVRKALANIPTYMIFDDHEITDDWNLNWKWCKEVYSKPLGRRTVQNGLLAYALFQAWGNTPNQFNETSKSDLLSAANTWRGADDSYFAKVKSLFNIPTIDEAASITDFPHHSGVIFNWHFDYQSNKYAVYVQDSRTWRSYPSGSSDIAFAKLISQVGYASQLPSIFPDRELILIVAPCPVVGEPFIEEQQHQKSTWKDRCDLDTEAWSLDQYGLQNLLCNLASRLPVLDSGAARQRIGRFAFLSGDVHYSLSARCQIWGSNNLLNDTVSGISTQALFAQLTASSFKNQTYGLSGALAILKNGTITLHNGGYPISISSSARGVKSLPSPSLNFAWIVGSNPVVGKFRPGTPSGLWDYGPVSSGLLLRSMEQLTHDHLEVITINPNWLYRIDWILGTSTGTEPRRVAAPTKIDISPSSDSRVKALQDYLAMTRDCSSYEEDWGAGKEIVGVNTLGEIRFNFGEPNKQINHIMWWRMSPKKGSTPLKLFPLTTFNVPMNYSGDTSHEGQPYSQPTFPGIKI